MAKTHTFSPSVTGLSGSLSGTPQTFTGGKVVILSETLPIGTDTLVALVLDVSQVKSAFIMASTATLLETNSGSSPAQTLSLAAGIPYIWNTNSYDTFKFTTDITALYCTNVAESLLTAEFLVDPTV